MSPPLLGVVLAYMAGLLLAPCMRVPLPTLFGLSFSLLILVFLLKPGRTFALWSLLFFAGWTNFATRTAVISSHDLRTLLGNEPALLTVRGQLCETPRLKIVLHDEQENWRNVARFQVTEIRHPTTAFEPAHGDILVTTPGIPGSQFFAGQPVEITGVMTVPVGPIAEGLFDFKQYLATRGIYYQLKTESTNDWKLLTPHLKTAPLTDRFLKWSQETLALGLPVEDEPLRLLWAMTLGWRTAFTGDISEPFLRAGTQHMFAIDGLRIALLAGMIVTILRALRLARAWCGALAIPIIWFYTAATGWEASAMRASMMMTIILGGWALKRPTDLLNSLAAAALIILWADPRQIFQAGFQLSFFVMLVIALMLPPLNRFFDHLLQPDPLLPVELVSHWQIWLREGMRRAAHYGALSFAAWIGSIPLSAKYFHLFSPVSTFANVLAVPLGTFALMANLGSLVCGQWLPLLTEYFNHAAWFFMVAMTWVSVVAARLPGACYYVPEPSWFTIALYYLVVLGAFSGWFHTRLRILSGMVVLSFLAGFYCWQWQSTRATTELTVLPLNGGHAVFVDAEGQANDWLINCGNENAVRFTLKNYLRAQGVNTLPRLVLATSDQKNIGGAPALKELFGIGELWTSGINFHSAAYREAVAAFSTNGSSAAIPHHFIQRGDLAGAWQVLFPDSTNGLAKVDDAPLVLRGNFHGTKILLLADLSRAGQSRLLLHTNDLPSDIVVAGLPTESEPLCGPLLDAIHPQLVVIADSELPVTRRAPASLRQRLEQTHLPVIYTRTAGAVKISTDKSGWRIQTMSCKTIQGHADVPAALP